VDLLAVKLLIPIHIRQLVHHVLQLAQAKLVLSLATSAVPGIMAVAQLFIVDPAALIKFVLAANALIFLPVSRQPVQHWVTSAALGAMAAVEL